MTETGVSTVVVGVVVESVRIGGVYETPNETGELGEMETGVEIVPIRVGTETLSKKSSVIETETGI